MRQLALARCRRVLDAIAEVRAVGCPDAASDPVLAAFKLGDDIGIGDMAAGHADKIDDVFADGVAGCRQIIDPRGVKNRKPDLPPEAAGLFKERRQRRRHAGHVVCQPRQAVDAAGDKIEEIDAAIIAKPRGDLDIVRF